MPHSSLHAPPTLSRISSRRPHFFLWQADVITRVDEELRASMLEAQSTVASWVTEQKHISDKIALNGQHALATDKENIEQLREDLDAIGAADDALQHKARDERKKVDELRSELEKLTAQESRLPPEQERLTQQLAQSRTLVSQREANCTASLASKEQKLAELDKGCALYRQRLGLVFERGADERLRLTFTNVDPNDPMKAFAFQVYVDGSDKYHVESCEPPVPGMDVLVKQLNTDNDFASFVRAMRKQFKALC